VIVVPLVRGDQHRAVLGAPLDLLADRAAGGHRAPVVRARARVALGHLLAVLPPLAPITDLP
jgi:hypothetical protein